MKDFVKKMDHLKIKPTGEIKIRPIKDDDKISINDDISENKSDIMVNRKIKIVDKIESKEKQPKINFGYNANNLEKEEKEYTETHQMMNILHVTIFLLT